MKVEVENCTSCGAKNSRFVQKCYRCGAALPWAPDYTPPAETAKPAGAPAPSPSPAPTVAVPPAPASPEAGSSAPDAMPPSAPGTTKTSPVMLAAVIGGPVLFIAIVTAITLTVLGRPIKNTANVAPPAQATPLPAAPAPGTPATPAPSSTPPAAAPTSPQPAASPKPAASPQPAANAAPGPVFLDLEKKLIDPSNTFTSLQKENYWQSVKGTSVQWQGEVQDVKPDSISLLCKGAANSYPVEVALKDGQTQILSGINRKQNVEVKGVLADRVGKGFKITDGELVLAPKSN